MNLLLITLKKVEKNVQFKVVLSPLYFGGEYLQKSCNITTYMLTIYPICKNDTSCQVVDRNWEKYQIIILFQSKKNVKK